MYPKLYQAFLLVVCFLFLGQTSLKAQVENDFIAYYKEKIKQIHTHHFEETTDYFHQLITRLSGKEKVEILLKKERRFANSSIPVLAKKTFQKVVLKKLLKVSTASKEYGNFERVFNDLEKTADSLGSIEKANTFKEVHFEHRLNTQEEEEAVRSGIEHEKELKKLYFLLALLSLLFLLALVTYIIYYKKNSYKRILLMQKEHEIKEMENKVQRKYELRETQRIQKDLRVKRKELMIDLSFKAKRMEKIESVLKKMEVLANKSIITKHDVKKMIDFATQKYTESLREEKLRKDMVFANKEFYDSLLKDFPKLSKTELTILSYISIHFNTKEIATIQHVSVDAVRKMRHRIRKKMGLEPEESLENFIIKYS